MLKPTLQSESEIVFNHLDIEKNLRTNLGFNVELGDPLIDVNDVRFNGMHSNERGFGCLLIEKGIIVYPEPKIDCVIQTPDFFVFNPDSYCAQPPYMGKFVELTLFKRSDLERDTAYGRRKYARKRRQRQVFEELGLPIVYICREDQERIRRMQNYSTLF
jgi:hypothetical protein